jgi:hypothetical protein
VQQTSTLILIVAGDYSTNEARNKKQLLFLAVAFGFGKGTFNPFHKLTASDSTNSKTKKRTMDYRLSFEQEEREAKNAIRNNLKKRKLSLVHN